MSKLSVVVMFFAMICSIPVFAENPTTKDLTTAVELFNVMAKTQALHKAIKFFNPAVEIPNQLPMIKVKDSSFIVEGAAYPLVVKDLSRGEYTLNGYVIKIDPEAQAEPTIDKISGILQGKKSAFNFILPEAQAHPAAVVAGAVYGIGAVGSLAYCYITPMFNPMKLMGSGGPSFRNCAVKALGWPFLAAAALLNFAAGEAHAAELPKVIDCTKASGNLKNTNGVNETALKAAQVTLAAGCKFPDQVGQLNAQLRTAELSPNKNAPATATQ